MSNRFASNKRALAMCDVCGFEYKLKELKNLVVKNTKTQIKACPECWGPSQPQLMLGTFPVDDPQAIRNPRPDQSIVPAGDFSSINIQWGWNPVGLTDPFGLTPDNLEGKGAVGQITVTIS